MKIYVVKLGWVLVGCPSESASGDVTLTAASTIRKWGTTQGLGQLALYGPTDGTVLDPCGTAYIRADSILFSLDCVEKNWGKRK